MAFISLDRLEHRRCQPLTINTDDISSFGATYTYGTDYYVKMKEGSIYWLTEESYRKLQQATK